MKQKFAIAFYFNEKITQYVKEGDNITAAIKSILRSKYNDILLSSSDLEKGIIYALREAGCFVDYEVLENHKQEIDQLLELFKGVTQEAKMLLESYDLLPPELLKKRLEYISKLKPW